MTDEVSLILDGMTISGWTDIEVSRSCEALPNTFQIGLTALPQDFTDVSVAEGSACVVRLGGDTVVTGYIDRVRNGGSARAHRLTIVGRGRCQDLVDCSAEWPGDQLVNGDALAICRQLASIYGIETVLAAGSAGPAVPAFALSYTDTPFSIIDRVTKAAKLLVYEDELGRLLLTTIGLRRAAGAITYGTNVEAWDVERSADQRFSEIVCHNLPVNTLTDIGGDPVFYTASDGAVARHRRLTVVAEAGPPDRLGFCRARADWELARRRGRGQRVIVTVSGWRDDAGTLWTPNTLVEVNVPGMAAGAQLCISSATFTRSNEAGTQTTLEMLAPEAFSVEPLSLLQGGIAEAIHA